MRKFFFKFFGILGGNFFDFSWIFWEDIFGRIFNISIPLSAAVEVLWEIDEDAVKNCVATAGFSVGEITSLIFSGALTFEDGVKLVNIRQIAMQQASDLVRF